MDWKESTITIKMDTDKDKIYNGNSWKIIEDWNKIKTREFSSKAEKQI